MGVLARIFSLLVFLAFLAGEGGDLLAQAGPSREYQVKAGFLFNLAQFVDWPREAFADADAPLVVGIVGADPFGPYLDELVRGEKVNNRQLMVQRFRRVEEIKTCHILFICQSETERLPKILASLKDRSILTVSDADNFAQRGGMIRLILVKNKIRFRINLEAAKAARLTLSSKLLHLSDLASAGGNGR